MNEFFEEISIDSLLMSDGFLETTKEKILPIRQMIANYRCAIMEVETKFNVLNEQYSLEYDGNPIDTIKTRVKSMESIINKAKRNNIPLTIPDIEENIRDIAGVRIICPFIEDIYLLADCLLQQNDVFLVARKDYIKHPKPNGYRSLHLIIQIPIFLETGKKMMYVEIQLRTIAMDFWANLEHRLRYKKSIPQDQLAEISTDLLSCAQTIAALDENMESIRRKLKPIE